MKRTGTWETVASIICFSGLIAYFNNPLYLIPMALMALLFIGFNGE